jgi:hypothetical protein
MTRIFMDAGCLGAFFLRRMLKPQRTRRAQRKDGNTDDRDERDDHGCCFEMNGESSFRGVV